MESLTKSFECIKQVFRRSQESKQSSDSSESENETPKKGSDKTLGISGDTLQTNKSQSKATKERSANLLDIDALLPNLFKSEEEEHKEVISIDIFAKTSLEGDEPIDQRRTVLRQLLLKSDKSELLPDLDPINFLTNMEMDLLLKRFQVSDLLIVAKVWPQLKDKICALIQSKPFIWFGTDLSKARLLPHEDCCDFCDHIIDTKDCIKLKENVTIGQVFTEFKQFCGQFSSLKCLRLFRAVITEETDVLLAQICPNLLHLDLMECKIIKFETFAVQHQNLRHLILTATAINDEVFKAFVSNKIHLKTISANYTNITGTELWRLPNGIQRIDIRGCHQLASNYLGHFMDFGVHYMNFDQLKCLRLEVVFDDNTFAQMCSTFNNLIILELNVSQKNVRLFTRKGLKHISRLSKLQTLKFGPNIAAHKIPLLDIFKGCPLMTMFSIDGSNCFVRFIEDENVLTRIADYWPLLQKLEFLTVDCIEGNVLNSLSRLKYLSYLDLTECTNVEDSPLIAAIEKLSLLRYLVLDKCHQLTIQTYNAVLEKARTMDSVLSVSFNRCNFFVYYTKVEDLPQNLRLTFASIKSKRFMTFDGYRTKVFRCQNLHELSSANFE